MLRFLYLLLFCVNLIHAQIESGFYLNPSVGYGYLSNNTRYNVTNNTSVTLGLMGGYAFNKYIAIDGGATFMPNTSPNQTANFYLTNVAARASVPFGNFASAYLHLGLAAQFNSSTIPNQYGFFTGIGALFNITKHISINVEDYGIYIPSSTNYDINVLAVGLVYGF